MNRYTPECVDGTLFLAAEGERLEIGSVDDVLATIGGDTHEIEYDQQQRTQPWLRTDDGVLEIDVRETVTTLAHTPETVSELRGYGMDTDKYGIPTRTVEFAKTVMDILEQQGE